MYHVEMATRGTFRGPLAMGVQGPSVPPDEEPVTMYGFNEFQKKYRNRHKQTQTLRILKRNKVDMVFVLQSPMNGTAFIIKKSCTWPPSEF